MIHAVGEALSNWKLGAPALVLHLGAGAGGNLPQLLALQPARVVLLDGDPTPQHTLSARAQHADASGIATPLAAAVSPGGGAVDWRRYSLGALNGPADHSALVSIYPRLRLLEQTRVPSIPLTDAVAQAVALQGQAVGPRLLLLDLPGQEDALLSVAVPTLRAVFDAIVVCGRGQPVLPGAAPIATAPGYSSLPAGGYRLLWSNQEAEPLWPVAFWLRVLPADTSPASSTGSRAGLGAISGADPAPGVAAASSRPGPATPPAPGLHMPRPAPAVEPVPADTLARLQRQLDLERERNDALAAQLDAAEAQIDMLKDLLLRESED